MTVGYNKLGNNGGVAIGNNSTNDVSPVVTNKAPEVGKTEAKEGSNLSYFDDQKGAITISSGGGYQNSSALRMEDKDKVEDAIKTLSVKGDVKDRTTFKGAVQAGILRMNIITITSGNKTQYIPSGTKKLYLDGSQGGDIASFVRANTACEVNEIVIDDKGFFDACLVILESGGGNWTFEFNTSSGNNDIVMDSDDLYFAELSSNDMILQSGGRALFTRSSNDWKLHSLSSVDGIITQTGTLQPIASNTYNLGASGKYWKEAYFGGKTIITADQIIRFADSGDNTVIVELSGVKIPANAIITDVAAVVHTVSDLSTHNVNIQMSATSGTGADSSISSGTELLGAGVANTDSTDGTSASDIDLKNDPKEVWVCRDTVRNGGSDQYIYVCNAGTGNGTTNSTAGTLTVIIEYYGMD